MKKEFNFNINGIEVSITKENTKKKYFSKTVNYFSRFFNEDTIYYYIDREDYLNPEDGRDDILALEDAEETVSGMRLDVLFEYLNIALDKKGYKREEKMQYIKHLFPDKEIVYATESTLIEMQTAMRLRRNERRLEQRTEKKRTLLAQLLEDISEATSENTDMEKVNNLMDTLKNSGEYEVVSGIFYFIKDDLLFIRKNGDEIKPVSPLALVSVVKSKVFTSK